MSTPPWTIPFDGVNYVCWTDGKGRKQHRKMTTEEERAYFTTNDREKYLDSICK